MGFLHREKIGKLNLLQAANKLVKGFLSKKSFSFPYFLGSHTINVSFSAHFNHSHEDSKWLCCCFY